LHGFQAQHWTRPSLTFAALTMALPVSNQFNVDYVAEKGASISAIEPISTDPPFL
jgi:hypothetical protein